MTKQVSFDSIHINMNVSLDSKCSAKSKQNKTSQKDIITYYNESIFLTPFRKILLS